ncbi:MAG: hypothetical protein ACR2G7_11905 [Acidimicrobiales bacterium]
MSGGSVILDYGTATATISPALFNAVAIRDHHCRFPGCDRRASWCEVHHLVHIQDGGPTCPGNLVLLCSRHHHRLHRPGWSAKLTPDGELVVTDPGGRVRSTHPPGHSRPTAGEVGGVNGAGAWGRPAWLAYDPSGSGSDRRMPGSGTTHAAYLQR